MRKTEAEAIAFVMGKAIGWIYRNRIGGICPPCSMPTLLTRSPFKYVEHSFNHVYGSFPLIHGIPMNLGIPEGYLCIGKDDEIKVIDAAIQDAATNPVAVSYQIGP